MATNLDSIAQQLQQSIQDSLLTSTNSYGAPVATGTLLSSIKVVPNSDGSLFDIFMEDYGYWIEKGRTPSKMMSKATKSLGKPLAPPLQPILDWVRARRIGKGNDEATAYAIMNRLRYKQTMPRPFITRGIQAVEDKVLDEIAINMLEPIDKVFQTKSNR